MTSLRDKDRGGAALFMSTASYVLLTITKARNHLSTVMWQDGVYMAGRLSDVGFPILVLVQ